MKNTFKNLIKFGYQNPYANIFLIFMAALFGHIFYILRALTLHKFDHLNWKILQYEISYFEYGFIKRGVFGSIFGTINNGLDKSIKYINIYTWELLFFVSFCFLVCKILKKSKLEEKTKIFMFYAVVLSPLGISAWSFDIGRLEHINFLIMIACFFLINKNNYMLASALSFLAVLVHEAFIIWGIPTLLIFAKLHLGGGWHRKLQNKAILITPSATAAIAVLYFGNIEDANQLKSLYSEFGPGARVWGRQLIETRNSLTTISKIFMPLYLFALSFVFLPLLLKKLKLRDIFALCLCFSTLFLLGFDYARWFHIIFVSLFLLTIFINQTEKSEHRLSRIEKIGWALIMFPLGPIGIGELMIYLHIIQRHL